MTPGEFETQLARTRDTLLRSQNYMGLYEQVAPTPAAIQNRYIGVFSNIESSLRLMSLLYLSVLFDSDRKTAGLPTLVRSAQQDPGVLAAHATTQDLRATRNKINAHSSERLRLKELRDKHLAHLDLDAEPVKFTKGEYDLLVADAEAVIRDLFWYYSLRGYTRESMDELSKLHWAEVLRRISD